MTEQNRLFVVDILRKAISQNGPIRLAHFKNSLQTNRVSEGLIREIGSPKSWVNTRCPELMIVGDCGYEKLCVYDKGLRALVDAIMAEDSKSLHMSKVRHILEGKGINVDSVTNGMRMAEYIQYAYPALQMNDDHQYITIPGVQNTIPSESLVTPETRTFINNLCFFAVSPNRIKTFTGDPSITASVWNDARVMAFAKALLGVEGTILSEDEALAPTFAVPAGVSMADGRPVYNICVENPNINKQRWYCSTCVYPGQDSDEARWLRDCFGITDHISRSTITLSIEGLQKKAEELKIKLAEIAENKQLFDQQLSVGAPIDEKFMEVLSEYQKIWQAILSDLDDMDRPDGETNIDIKTVEHIINEYGKSTWLLEKAGQVWAKIVTGAWTYMFDNGLVTEDKHENELNKWAVETNDQGNDRTERLSTLLKPYKAMQKLRAAKNYGFGDEEILALDDINAYFNSRLSTNRRVLSMTFWSDNEDDFAFLDSIDELDELIIQIQKQEIQRSEAGQGTKICTSEELVYYAINGGLLKYIYTSFAQPSEIESAVMTGDLRRFQELLNSQSENEASAESRTDEELFTDQTITPLSAAKRLVSFNSNSRQIEKCLLLALYVSEQGAPATLIEYYLDHEINELAKIVFCKNAEKLDEDQRYEFLERLMDCGALSLRDALQFSLMPMLTEKGIAFVESIQDEESTELKTDIISLYREIQPTFLHHIVFQSQDLNNYILNPENKETIKLYGVDMSEDGVLAVLKQSDYSRGTSALQIASRLFSFVGTWGDLAERFAALAEDTTEKAKLLLAIAQRKEDEGTVKKLFAECPELREENKEEYSAILFNEKRYAEICDFLKPDISIESPASQRKRYVYSVFAIWTGEQTDVDLSLVSDEFTDDKEYLVELSKKISSSSVDVFREFLVRVFKDRMPKLNQEELKTLIADNIPHDALRKTRDESAEECPRLAAICDMLMPVEDSPKELYQAYQNSLIKKLTDDNIPDKQQVAEEIQTLYPSKQDDIQRIVTAELIKEIAASDADNPTKAKQICSVLMSYGCEPDQLENLLTAFGDSNLLCSSPLREYLWNHAAENDAMEQKLLKYFWERQDIGSADFKMFLCRCSVEVDSRGSLPEEWKKPCEDLALECLRVDQSIAEFRTYVIQQELNRGDPHRIEFIRDFAPFLIEEDTADAPASENAEHGERDEFDLFCDVVEANEDYSDYLNLCSAFIPYAEISDIQDSDDAHFSRVGCLHALYHHPQDSNAWKQLILKPVADRKIAYAKLLKIYAEAESAPQELNVNRQRSANAINEAWNNCLDYGRAELMYDYFFDCMNKWILSLLDQYQDTFPWFCSKNLIQAIQDALDKESKETFFAKCSSQTAESILNNLLNMFGRIERSSSPNLQGKDSNHTTLRTIIEFAERMNIEDIVINKEFDKLAGIYSGLGVALICRLILGGKVDKAIEFLRLYAPQERREHKYGMLVNKMAAMEASELRIWAEKDANRRTLQFILPHGNAPDVYHVQDLIMQGIMNPTADWIGVAENLVDCYPNDPICYIALLIFSKENYLEHISTLLKAMYGFYKNYPSNMRLIFTRSRDEVLSDITILRFVAEKQDIKDIPAETVTELIRKYNINLNESDISKRVEDQNRLNDELVRSFIGVSIGTKEYYLRIHNLMGAVTCNWRPFFAQAYQMDRKDYIGSYGVRNATPSSFGVLRGILGAWKDLPDKEEQDKFSQWIMARDNLIAHRAAIRTMPSGNGAKKFSFAENLFNMILRRYNSEDVDWKLITNLPWEEHMVCLGNIQDIDRPELTSCFKVLWPTLPRDRRARDPLYVAIVLSQDVFKGRLCHELAVRAFKAGQYEFSGAIYEAVYWARVVPERVEAYSERWNYWQEFDQCWCRISYCMANVPQNPISEHSWVNMIVAFINSGAASGIDRLYEGYLHAGQTNHGVKANNSRLYYAIREIIVNDIPDQDKLKKIDSISMRDASGRSELAFLKFLTQSFNRNYFFLTDQDVIYRAVARCRELETMLSASNKKNTATVWLPLTMRPDPRYIPPLQVIEEEDDTKESSIALDSFTPSFLADAEKYTNEELAKLTQNELQEKYESLSTFQDADFSKRLAIAAQQYTVAAKDNPNTKQYERYAIQFGVMYYRYYARASRSTQTGESPFKKAHHSMLELARFCVNSKESNDVTLQNYFIEWFNRSIRSFDSLLDLLKDYDANKNEYDALQKILSGTGYASQARSTISCIGKLLDVLERQGELTIIALQDMQNTLNATMMPESQDLVGVWRSLRSHLLELTRKAINEVNKRPVLRLTVINDTGMENDCLFGQVENTGEETAYDLRLQATFPTNARMSASSEYMLPMLIPQGIVTFAISYKADTGKESLGYILNLTFNDSENKPYAEAFDGLLTIDPVIHVPEKKPQFEINKACSFTVNEEGQIVSSEFRGRGSELQRLRALVKGESFEEEDSAIIQGIKRSGKTSLLNYFEKYLQLTRNNNTIVVKADGQQLSSSTQKIYRCFFLPVLQEVPLKCPEVLDNPRWEAFVEKWTKTSDAPDSEPDDMSFFYREAHSILQDKGIFLIVDEFDVVYESIWRSSKRGEELLRALRVLQMDQNCFEAIHILLCGSNKLLSINREGSFTNQMFQSYKTIKLGQMLTADIREMIEERLNKTTGIYMDDGGYALQWLERYTGGLVWYTRLLVNEAVKLAVAQGRNCIYPSDIYAAFGTVCQPNFCRQFSEGCSEEQDIPVLNTIAELTEHYGQFVSFDQIVKKMDGKLTPQQVMQSLLMLTDGIDLLEKKSPTSELYKFRVEIYRQFFRSQNPKLKSIPDGFIEKVSNVAEDTMDSEFGDL